MDLHPFTCAKAVFIPESDAARDRAEHSVTHYGFYHSFPAPVGGAFTVAIAARNAYRLYINGAITLHGPARTAHGYARVDVVPVRLEKGCKTVHLAIEIMTYGDTYNGYSNSCTLEPGLLTAEVTADCDVLSATGRDNWRFCRLSARLPRTERMSHSGLCCEIADLRHDETGWRTGLAAFSPAVPCAEPVYLARRAPLPTLQPYAARNLIAYGSIRMDETLSVPPSFWNRPLYTSKGYYESLPVHAFEECLRTVEDDEEISLSLTRDAQNEITLRTEGDAYLSFDMGESHVGFISLEITAQNDGIVDILRTEALEKDGSYAFMHNIVTRLYVKQGRNAYITFEPGLARYLKLYLRGTGTVTLHRLSMLDYTFPDNHACTFLCSDETINRLYQAAKKTLLLNTLDVFMDCPDRERGGWLCDSLWTARAACLMLSDSGVERDMLENFLLTKGMYKGFFPEVYPGNSKGYATNLPITTWSFWLLCELCEYVLRTGDKAFALEHTARVEEFVRGSSSYIGSTGLIENLPGVFVDWSLSNNAEYQKDVSTAANALYAYMLIELGKVYDRPDWTQQGVTMRHLLRTALLSNAEQPLHKLTAFPDGLTRNPDGTLTPGDRISESGIATALWANLFTRAEAPALYRNVREAMGPASRYPANPNIGGSGLFIGLCIRMDLLARAGFHDTLFADLNAIYQPQLREGPGTLWENCVYESSSRCHGFNAHAGVHLLRDTLGLGIPQRLENGRIALTIAPHLNGLRWASGTLQLPEGLLSLKWKYDGDTFLLDLRLPHKDLFDLTIELPNEVKALDASCVTVRIR